MPRKGQAMSASHRDKLIALHRGQALSPAHRAKIAATLRGRPGRPLSEETKAKIAASKKGKKINISAVGRAAIVAGLRRHRDVFRRPRGPMPEWHKLKVAAGLKGHPVTEETREKIAAARIGKPGHPLSAEHKAQLIAANRLRKGAPGPPRTEAWKAKISMALKGKPFTPEHLEHLRNAPQRWTMEGRRKIAESNRRRRGKPLSPEAKAKLAARPFPRLPTKPERAFGKICADLGLPFKYVGNNTLRIGGINPDFVNEEHRIAVEVFGDYWHTPLLLKKALPFARTERGRREILSREGWRLLVFWESEFQLSDIVQRVEKRIGSIWMMQKKRKIKKHN